MIQNIIEYFNTRLSGTGYFESIFGLCIKVTRDAETFPALYAGDGEFRNVIDFDTNSGTVYWRKAGDYTIVPSDIASPIAGKRMVTVTMPMRVVFVIKKSDLPNDNNYSIEKLAMQLIRVMTEKAYDLKSALKARNMSVNVNRLVDDPTKVWQSEFDKNKQVRFEWAVFSLDMNIVVDIMENCIVDECETYDDQCSFYRSLISESDRVTCILPTFDFSDAVVQDGLSEQQRNDLIAWLCGTASVNVYVNGELFDVEVAPGNVNVPVVNTNSDTVGTIGGGIVEVADSVVKNSDDSFTVNVPAETSETLPDVTVVDEFTTASVTWPSVKNLTIKRTVRVITTTGAGVWTKPANLLYIDVLAIGGGGGGGSGRNSPTGTNACGGCGGNPGLMARNRIIASALGATENYSVGAGGPGGAGQSSNANGNTGTAGEQTNFGTLVVAPGGFGGVGGVSSTTTTAQNSQGILLCTPPLWPNSHGSQQPLASTNTTGGVGVTFQWATNTPSRFLAGGNGGGLNTTNVITAGGPTPRWMMNDALFPVSLAGGTSGGGAGSNGPDNHWTSWGMDMSVYTHGIGLSGAGGGSAIASNGGDGGNGGLYGGAGGGGGACRNTFTSGKGGDGAQGLLIIVEYTIE